MLIEKEIFLAKAYEEKSDFYHALYHYEKAYSLSYSDNIYFSILFCKFKLAKTQSELFSLLYEYDQFLLRVKPDFCYKYALYYNRAIIFRNLGFYDLAQSDLNRTLDLNPSFSIAKKSLGEIKLLHGDFLNGWILYQNRERVNLPLPLWNLSMPTSSQILICDEQGIGDNIQFFRYLLIAKELGYQLIIKNSLILKRLLEFNLELHGINYIQSDSIFADCYANLMDLPYILFSKLPKIPCKTQYLVVPPIIFSDWENKIQYLNKLKVGVFWASHSLSTNAMYRNIDLEDFSMLFSFNADFHCLQKDLSPNEEQIISGYPNVTIWKDELTDFAETAGLISQLDLVICVDTAVAHLAGALGKKVWILLPFNPDFRWGLNKSDSLWYPTATLFRQSQMNDWSTVLSEVSLSLEQHINTKMQL